MLQTYLYSTSTLVTRRVEGTALAIYHLTIGQGGIDIPL